MTARCPWTGNNDLMIRYHDTEWGIPLHDDTKLFEFLLLDTFQAGLSWAVVLNKRDNFRSAFDNFDIKRIAAYNEDLKLPALLNNSGIIRNKLKIQAAISNARAFIKVQEEFGTFDKFIWAFVEGRAIQNNWNNIDKVPVKTDISDFMSRELKLRGFKFAGSTICYAFMQAAGLVNDHLTSCFRHNQIKNLL